MSVANQYEQQMLDLINKERAAAGLSPLVFNSHLNDASEEHSAWMLETDTFSHRGADGSSARDRIEDSGYELTGRWRTGENIAWVSERGQDGYSDEVVKLHNNLMNSPEHRANILNPNFKEIGIGIEVGDFVENGKTVQAVMVTQNFGVNASSPSAPAPVPAPVEESVLAAVAPASDAETEHAAAVATPAPAIAPVASAPVIQSLPVANAAPTPSATLDVMAFLQSRGFRNNTDRASTSGESTGFSRIETSSVRSGVEVETMASDEGGPSVTIEGEGNFTGAGGATAGGATVTDMDSGKDASGAPAAPAEVAIVEPPVAAVPTPAPAPVAAAPAPSPMVDVMAFLQARGARSNIDQFGAAREPSSFLRTETGSDRSRLVIETVADPDEGPSLMVEGEGNFSGTGTASVSVGGETDTASSADSRSAMGIEMMANDGDALSEAEGAPITAPAFVMPTGIMARDQSFDIAQFISRFGPNATSTSGSTLSRAALETVASQENGPSVEVIDATGNFELLGSATVDGEQEVVALDGMNSDPMVPLVGVSLLQDEML